MRKIPLILSMLVYFLIGIGHAETIVFEGTPLVRNSSSAEEAKNELVQGESQTNYKLIISKEGDEYVWFSREKKKLTRIRSDAFDYFVNPEGSGYIKIAKDENGKYLYMEHMSFGLQTITYWGTSETFKP